ncbi:ATP-binding protein [Streptomyces sp. NRRL F-5135]|uniref:ATP-binding protein n=1 Tax=Streptomyces sp. NRRL F-5135 TaxID=1463858 RepID=UPI00099C1FBA|nr:ATP-binding protein [Streptomyces sp. NRRL F-5135]
MNHEITDTGHLPLTQSAPPTEEFRVLLSSTLRGARLARLLTVEQLRSWGLPYESAAQVVAELAANAVTHGRTPGRDFRLTVRRPAPGLLRIEVTDTREARLPHFPPAHRTPPGESESGRGLLVVTALADRWGVVTGPAPCKTVRAELTVPGDGP